MKLIIQSGFAILGTLFGVGLGATIAGTSSFPEDAFVAGGAVTGTALGILLAECLLIVIGSRKPRRPYGVVRTVPKESVSRPFADRLAGFAGTDHCGSPTGPNRATDNTRRPMRFWTRHINHQRTAPRPAWFFSRLLRKIRKLVRATG